MRNIRMSNGRVCNGLIVVFLAVVFSMGVPVVGATPVLDQVYFDPDANFFGSSSFAGNRFRRAQTFTVGIGGTLDHVDMRGEAGSSMRILETTGGVPTFTVLASTGSFLTTVDGWICWDLSSSGLAVMPGDLLAMDMLGGGWEGHKPGEYAGGADYFLNATFGTPNFTFVPGRDRFLRTFVDVSQSVPEPSTLFLLGTGLLGLLGHAGDRKARTTPHGLSRSRKPRLA